MRVLETRIQISASPEKVWSILTDFETYSEWNPFIKNVQGQIKVGAKLTIDLSPPRTKAMVFKPMVKSVVENREFSWVGHFLFPGIFDGEHIFKIKPTESGCLFIQKENFSGFLLPLLWENLDKDTREGFEQMNQALKEKAENQNQ